MYTRTGDWYTRTGKDGLSFRTQRKPLLINHKGIYKSDKTKGIL